jgi:predicted RNase H-like nuclease
MPSRRNAGAAGAIFLGLDLAWSETNPSGLAALAEDGTVLYSGALPLDAAGIAAWVRQWARPTTVLGIDMPTIVRNPSGARCCEACVAHAFRRYDAAPHPANTGLPLFADGGRARRILDALARDGFRESLTLGARAPGRHAFEVFPHPAHVVLFGRARIFRYKKKSGRAWTDVWHEWRDYRTALAGLSHADPPMRLPASLPESVEGLKGRRYKEWDDVLDALTCAYVAGFVWRHGPDSPAVLRFGNLVDGYILIPGIPAAHEGRQAGLGASGTGCRRCDQKES